MKLQIALKILIFALPVIMFAQGGGSPGDGDDGLKPTGKVYRCFANLGHTLSTAQNPPEWSGHAQYCVPKRPTGCMKYWSWSLDPKNDKVEETEASKKCNFTECRPNGGCNWDCHVFSYGAGRGTPVESYFYCTIDSDFSKVARCIDKSNGNEVPNSLCDNDANGTNYYYKPKCEKDDTREECEKKLQQTKLDFGWRFCYEPPAGGNVNSFLRNQGGQTVRFREFIAWDITGYNRTGPCEQMAFAPSSGGAPDPDPDKPKDPLGKLVIIDWDDSKQPTSKVHTKISGKNYDFKIYAESGKIDSGLKEATCQISSNGTVIHQGKAGNAFSWSSFMAMKFSAPSSAFPQSGKYTIKCVGTNKNGDSAEAEVEYLVAPHLYQFGSISLDFEKDGAPISEALNTQTIKVENKKLESLKHSNNDWKKKPIVKINEPLKLQVKEVIAYTAEGKIDEGVDTASAVNGVISISKTDSKSNAQSITSATPTNNKPSTRNAQGACSITPNITDNNAEMTKGRIMNVETIATLTADNALVANAEVIILDSVLQEQIKQQEAQNLCTGEGGNFPCPYPGRIKAEFEYQVVPTDFKVELKTHKGDDLKVLYFGQGSTPAVEKGAKVIITALKKKFDANAPTSNNDIATTFSVNCAAQDMTFALDSANGIKIELVDKSGNIDGAKVPYNLFKDGKIELNDAILKVTKGDVPFTPNMKSEPIIIDKNTLKNNMSFFAFENSYYPRYDNIANANIDMLVLRARINAIDTDNHATNFGNATPTKVYYEFQCEYCNLDKVGKITGVNKYDRSPTQQGWWIDKTFSNYNGTQIDANKVEIESLGKSQIKAVSSVTNGFQDITYNFLSAGTYKLNILHGNFTQGATALSMPNFLLYNAYWNESVKWNTSAFIYAKGKANDEQRDYGVDTGGAKNTRSGGRTGKY